MKMCSWDQTLIMTKWKVLCNKITITILSWIQYLLNKVQVKTETVPGKTQAIAKTLLVHSLKVIITKDLV